ncbi:LysR family transcriptional regulator [Hydrogenophaga sp.]
MKHPPSSENWTQLSVTLLRSFATVYSEMSVTRAAVTLDVPQSTLGTSIARLREIYQDPLFVPGGGRLEPTVKAHEIAPTILEVLARLEQSSFPRAHFQPGQVSTLVRVAMVDLVQSRLLPRLTELLACEAPQVRLSVTNFVAESVEHDLASRMLDLAVASTALTLRNVRYSQLFRERFTCVLRVGHPLAQKKWTLKQFASLQHIQVSPVGSIFVSMMDRVLAKHDVKRHIHHFVPTYDLAAKIVGRSDCVALMPIWMAESMSADDDILITKAPPLTLTDVPVIQMWHERSQTDPFHRWFRQKLSQVARDVREQ